MTSDQLFRIDNCYYAILWQDPNFKFEVVSIQNNNTLFLPGCGWFSESPMEGESNFWGYVQRPWWTMGIVPERGGRGKYRRSSETSWCPRCGAVGSRPRRARRLLAAERHAPRSHGTWPTSRAVRACRVNTTTSEYPETYTLFYVKTVTSL